MLEMELERFVEEMPPLGMLRMWLIGDLAMGTVGVESLLDLVIIQETDEPYHRREDFWNIHLRPRVGTRFHVFTSAELESLEEEDPVLRSAMHEGELVHG